MARFFWVIAAAFCLALSVGSLSAGQDNSVQFERGARELLTACDPGIALSDEERDLLFNKLRISIAGRSVLADFNRQYGPFSNLLIQWDTVSYSQVVTVGKGRSPAGVSQLGNGVCVHLTRKLPEIEHIADLAHELTHATRLTPQVLHGEVTDVAEFVRARLTAQGGEADAFTVECKVKHELLGRWDEFCSPYVSVIKSGNKSSDASGTAVENFDTAQVTRDFYSGQLSASLTGETYPVMLSRQYKAMLAKRSRIQYATIPYAGK